MSLEQFSKFAGAAADVGQMLGGATSLLGGIGGAFTAAKNRRDARKMQREMMEWQSKENRLAFERNINLWELQNSYNSPSAQVKRLLDAGLNPNLAYGSLSAGQADSAPQYQPANVPPLSEAAYSNPYDSLSVGASQLSQSSSQLSQIQLNRANEKKVNAETIGEIIRNNNLPRALEMEYNNLSQQFENNKEMQQVIKNNANLIGKQANLLDVQVKKVNKEIAKIDKEIKILNVDLFVRKATQNDAIKKIRAEANISDEQARTITVRIAQELKQGSLSIQALQNEVTNMSWDLAMRQAGLAIEWQNKYNAALAEGNSIDAAEVLSSALKQVAPEQAKRLVAHQGSIFGDLTYFASEIIVPLLQLIPKYSSSEDGDFQSQDGKGNYSKSRTRKTKSFGF